MGYYEAWRAEVVRLADKYFDGDVKRAQETWHDAAPRAYWTALSERYTTIGDAEELRRYFAVDGCDFERLSALAQAYWIGKQIGKREERARRRRK